MKLRMFAAALSLAAISTAAAQDAPRLRLELRPFAGVYVPTGAMADDFKSTSLFGVQPALEVNHYFHVLGSVAWTDGRSKIAALTNDAANIAAGSNVSAEERIRRVMDVIGGDPVMWVNAVTQRTDNAYRNASMLAWNDELDRLAADYPNMRVFDWYDVVQPQWFRNDGIHYTVEGSAQRAALTAQALVDNFPGT